TPCSLDMWNLSRPLTPECLLGRSAYSTATMYTEALESTPSLLAFRTENVWGAVIYDRQRVQDVAAAQSPGCYVFNDGTCMDPDPCSTSSQDSGHPYKAQILTHPETIGTFPKPLTFGGEVFDAILPGGSTAHSIAAIAAGFNVDSGSSDYTCAALVLADLSETPTPISSCSSCPKDTPTIQPLAVAYAPFAEGNAVAVRVGTICDRRYAFVAD